MGSPYDQLVAAGRCCWLRHRLKGLHCWFCWHSCIVGVTGTGCAVGGIAVDGCIVGGIAGAGCIVGGIAVLAVLLVAFSVLVALLVEAWACSIAAFGTICTLGRLGAKSMRLWPCFKAQSLKSMPPWHDVSNTKANKSSDSYRSQYQKKLGLD